MVGVKQRLAHGCVQRDSIRMLKLLSMPSLDALAQHYALFSREGIA